MKFSKIALILGIALFSKASAQDLPMVNIDSVSVIDDNTILISWQAPNDARIDGYNIYRIDIENQGGESKFLEEAFVSGRTTTSFVYRDNNTPIDYPSVKSLRFFVAAVDKDVTPARISALDSNAKKPHKTIHLKNSIDLCNNEAVLTWNSYEGWDSGISRYEILESQNGGPYRSIALVSGRTMYNRRGLSSGINYQYKVKAVSGNLVSTSTSNNRNVSGTFSMPPTFVYLANASVNPNNRAVTITWVSDTTNLNLTFQVMGSTDSVNFVEYARLDSVPYQRVRTAIINNVAPDRENYYFKVITSCACPDTIDTTNVVKTVRLRAEYIDATSNMIYWNDFEGWNESIGYFELYRVKLDPVQNTLNSELIQTLFPGDTSYLDSDPDLAGADNTTSYYLRTFEQVGNPYIDAIMSQSNFAYIYRDITILVPGAFTPNSANPVFLPRIQSANSNKFNMKIYNRWGKLVFETDNEFLGWDGKDRDSGEICLPGGYVYIIEALDSTGKNLKKVGSVVLLD